MEAEGWGAIVAAVTAAQAQFPNLVFRLVGPVDGHHRQFRFTWELGLEGAEALVVGFDVVTVDGDGRLKEVLGFLDRTPAAL